MLIKALAAAHTLQRGEHFVMDARKNVTVKSIKLSFNTFTNRLSTQLRCSALCFVFPLRLPWLSVKQLSCRKHARQFSQNTAITAIERRDYGKNGKSSERNAICRIFILVELQCMMWLQNPPFMESSFLSS